jgi:hypothetical protein
MFQYTSHIIQNSPASLTSFPLVVRCSYHPLFSFFFCSVTASEGGNGMHTHIALVNLAVKFFFNTGFLAKEESPFSFLWRMYERPRMIPWGPLDAPDMG